jgi:hypothetical protein
LSLQAVKDWLVKRPRIQLSLSFGEHGIHMVRLGDHAKLQTAVSFPKEHAQVMLAEYVKEHSLQKKSCVCILPRTDYQTFLLEKPQVPAAEMLKAIRWRISDCVDYPIDASLMDYIELPFKKGAPKMMYVIVAKKLMLDEHLDMVKKSGLVPVIVDIPQLAQAQLFNQEDSRCKALLVIEEKFCQLQIYKNQRLLLMRQIELSLGDNIQHTLESNAQTLALQIQRSLDYCSSNLVDTQNTMLFVENGGKYIQLMTYIEEIIGLKVHPLSIDALDDMPVLSHYDMLSALGGIYRGRLK